MLKIAIVLGSTRPNCVGAIVAEWVNGLAGKGTDAEFKLDQVVSWGTALQTVPLQRRPGENGEDT
jgi:NAD(P)H-dependent FMN reductase